MLIFGWDFEVGAWSRFWRCLIKICVRICDMTLRSYFGKQSSTLGTGVPFLCFSSFLFPEVLKWGLLSSSSRAVFKVVECLWSFLAAAQSLNQQKGCKRDTFCQRATSHWTKKGGNSSHFIPILEFVTSTQRQRPSLRSYKGKAELE